MPSLADTWNELSNMEGVNLTVARNGISNYGQVISTTCETIATSYNNYYVESFQNTTANYFIYTISTTFPVAKVSTIKYLVYQHIFNEVFSLQLKTVEIPGDILPSTKQDDKRKIQGFVGNLIFEIRNRLPLFPVTKETLNKAPFGIMPALRHMLSKYETLIANNPNPQIQEPEQKPHDKSNTKAKKQKGKKQTKKKFIPPEQNLQSIFLGAALEQEHNETSYNYTLRCFYKCFDFDKLKELNDITAEEVEQYFRPCSIDPERIDVFISYHGGNDIRHLPSSEYYNMHRIVTRQKSEQGLKKRSGL
ncbi:uncharacterized protein RHIMIDRAFT_238058 [Rhizopus microsporus ATCC 52813]|uniref:Uncharacterized protein n=1 Tax=Rhizopus microsporus ATCC 52813 TaxID=1340429 RepID=A0A2G4STZ2_RHIZD|nr:uncharacterized protein RHIMIDRAFT_238058 [Rhizopus microsporus ATCC 52813]PHZ12243.1 hypothetical protein RHIMIDRAFT_238058 [Rhizopus microsporus ATCC 52813]